jgi:hypothetical protein
VTTTTTNNVTVAGAPIVLFLKRQHGAKCCRSHSAGDDGWCRLQRAQQQHLHEIVEKDSKPDFQKTMRNSGRSSSNTAKE